MEVAFVVEDAAGEDVEIERPADVLSLARAPLERGQADLKSQECPNGLAVPRILVSKSVELVRLVVESDFRARELRVDRHEIRRVNRLTYQRQLLSEVLQVYLHYSDE